jgi:hypothetical protein
MAAKPSEKRCGDGVCDGPENDTNCPEDCVSKPTQEVETSDACFHPNPHHAIVSEELVVWHNWLQDRGFEEGSTEVVISDHPDASLARATVDRVNEAARSGSFGYAITAGQGEGVTFQVKAYSEKGDDIRFSFWARSINGNTTIQPMAYGSSRATRHEPSLIYTPERTYEVGSEWTQVVFAFYNTSTEDVYLTLEAGPGTTLHIDDVQIEQHIWQMADYSGESRLVGGIPVPLEPVAPLHMTVLIHIEDPPQLQTSESYFQQETAKMRELARVLHSHGGHLTIQPEEDWPMYSQIWEPSLLAELVQEYDVVYSTHTHGPHCRDEEGRLRSSNDCRDNRESDGWDHTANDHEYPYVVDYVRNLRDLLQDVSGIQVTDHNGNFEFGQASRYAEIPMLTLSAYKNKNTQGTYDMFINNPWRPTECDANKDIDKFLTHDPNTSIVYIPGWGQNVARYLDRLETRLAPMLSQFIRHVDADRVNTFYIVTHVGSFYPRNKEDVPDYISYNPGTGEVEYSDQFLQDLTYWDEMLTELIDPLVEAGYVEWTSLPEMGELYLEWEEMCRTR